MARPNTDKKRARLARLEELGFSYRELGSEGLSLVTVIGEATADAPTSEAHRPGPTPDSPPAEHDEGSPRAGESP